MSMIMRLYRKLGWAMIFIFSLLSCDGNQDEISLMLPPHEDALIVECYLEPGENYRALVTTTMDIFDTKETETVDSVKVIVFSEGEEKELHNMETADTLYNKIYNYWLPEKVRYKEGQEFQISVSYGEKVRASGRTRFLPKARIAETYFKFNKEVDSMASIYIKIEDNPAEKNFYRIVARGLNPSLGYTYEGLWDDENAAEGTVTAYTNYSFLEGNRIVLNVYHLEEQYYRFLKSVKLAQESNYNPFMQPASIHSSLEGISGIFTAITLTSDTLVVEREK